MKTPVKKQSATNQKTQTADFFAMSLSRFVVLSLLTFTFYHIYWFYRNWKAIKVAEKSTIRPVWRAIFIIFFIWSFVRKVFAAAESRSYKPWVSYKVLAVAYIIATLAAYVTGSYPTHYVLGVSITYAALAVFSTLLMIPVQQAINVHAGKHASPSAAKGVNKAEVTMILVGVLVSIFNVIALFMPHLITPAEEPRPAALQTLYDRAETLDRQYIECMDTLNAKPAPAETASEQEWDTYNQKYETEYDACEAIRKQQNLTVERYEELAEKIGY